MRFRSIVLFVLALSVVTAALSRWRRPPPGVEQGALEEGIVLAPTSEPTPLPPQRPLAAPALSEVQATLDRAFEQTLSADQATRPAFGAGDFNGDDVTDLAVAVQVRNEDARSRLNAAMAPWSVQDADAPASSAPLPVQLASGDRLLAVIHGVSSGGWRNPEARQCYLVKNAVGSGLRLRPLAGVPAAIRLRASRTHVGDVIVTSRGGRRGLIFWTGAAYVWANLEAGE